MSLTPAMLAIRFLLELTALTSFGVLGWRATESPWNYLLAAALPLLAATAWATFTVPGDPSRNGKAPVPVSGPVRLAVETAVLAGGAAALWFAHLPQWALASGLALAAYWTLTYDRFTWLLTSNRK